MNHFLSFVAVFSISMSFLLGGNAPFWRALARVESLNELFPVDLPTGETPAPEAGITGMSSPISVFVLPDATKAIVSNGAAYPNANLFSLDLTTSPISISASTSLTGAAVGQALSPDGTKLFAIAGPSSTSAGDIFIVNTSDLSVNTIGPQTLFGTYIPMYVAVVPVGSSTMMLLTTGTNVIYVAYSDFSFIVSQSFDPSVKALFLVTTPGVTGLFLTDLGNSTVWYVNMLEEFTPVQVANMPSATEIGGICMSFDGSNVYTVIKRTGQDYYELAKIDVSTQTYLSSFPIPTGSGPTGIEKPGCLSITPDGKTVCFPDEGGVIPGQYVCFLDVGGTGASTIIDITAQASGDVPSFQPDLHNFIFSQPPVGLL